ncbi:MAG: hypothetical protein RL264_430 [Bacteroidota bacterium]|jgi:hypothetical protein
MRRLFIFLIFFISCSQIDENSVQNIDTIDSIDVKAFKGELKEIVKVWLMKDKISSILTGEVNDIYTVTFYTRGIDTLIELSSNSFLQPLPDRRCGWGAIYKTTLMNKEFIYISKLTKPIGKDFLNLNYWKPFSMQKNYKPKLNSEGRIIHGRGKQFLFFCFKKTNQSDQFIHNFFYEKYIYKDDDFSLAADSVDRLNEKEMFY